MHHCHILLFCCFIITRSLAQSAARDDVNRFQQQIENTTQQQEDPDYSALLETLAHYRKHPINLNHTTIDELQELNLLSDLQINQLFSHLEKNGKLLSLLELQSIEGFDLSLIQALLPYVYAADPINSIIPAKQQLSKELEQNLILRYSQVLEKQLGFRSIDANSFSKNPNSRYLGNPQKLYARYQVRLNTHISAGFTAEKDPGEAFLKKNIPGASKQARNGFDFYSAHVFVQHIKCLQALVIGDFTLTVGQGLTAWNATSFGKSSVILYAKKTAQGIRPYSSVDENKFMRGIAATFQQKKIFLTIYYSKKAIDANISDTLS
ncbi:MAG TPA: hypothetical protein VFF27_06745, partial [Bacteroidia bacterium]|nr:hypothetical protein [Bacteroidia bacterium]